MTDVTLIMALFVIVPEGNTQPGRGLVTRRNCSMGKTMYVKLVTELNISTEDIELAWNCCWNDSDIREIVIRQ